MKRHVATALAAIVTSTATPALAQDTAEVLRNCWFYGDEPQAHHTFTGFFRVPATLNGKLTEKKVEAELIRQANSAGLRGNNVRCEVVNPARPEQDRADDIEYFRRWSTSSSISAWVPDVAALIRVASGDDADSATRVARLDFRSAKRERTDGYVSASIDLRYRFLLCAEEVQVAYGLDKASLKVSPDYQVKDGDALRTVPSPANPVAPTTVALDALVSLGDTNTFVAQFKDAVAGEALGFGCFTGQTKKIGTLASFVSYLRGKSRKDVLYWLDGLRLRQSFNTLPTVLRHAGSLVEAPVAKPVDHSLTPEQSAAWQKVHADARAKRERERQAVIDHAAAVAAVEARNAASLAKAARDKEAYEAKMAEWRRKVAACQAGDRTACAQ